MISVAPSEIDFIELHVIAHPMTVKDGEPSIIREEQKRLRSWV